MKGSNLVTIQLERPRSGGHCGDYVEEVSDDSIGSHFKNGRFGIFVDGHNVFTRTHTRKMLDRSADAAGNVQRWADNLTGLTHLHTVG